MDPEPDWTFDEIKEIKIINEGIHGNPSRRIDNNEQLRKNFQSSKKK
ncbi:MULTISPECIES: hypothetical protein [Aerococcus]|nr:hypothetical protein [Aerococcus suis]